MEINKFISIELFALHWRSYPINAGFMKTA